MQAVLVQQQEDLENMNKGDHERKRHESQLLDIDESDNTSGDGKDVKTGIVFGREKNGLSNEELSLCDGTIFIPTVEHYPVLNLAQSVNVIGYEMYKRRLSLINTIEQEHWESNAQIDDKEFNEQRKGEGEEGKGKLKVKEKQSKGGQSYKDSVASKLVTRQGDPLATRTEVESFFDRLEESLFQRGYSSVSKNNNNNNNNNDSSSSSSSSSSSIGIDVSHRAEVTREERAANFRGLRAIFQRFQITRAESKMLHGMVTALTRQPINSSSSNNNNNDNKKESGSS
jgi:tRNA C32,U32 (ribose-2'-O)-methylase TrmJ